MSDASSSTISILGCGWLGLPLLRDLAEAGHRVRGSSRSPDTLAEIEAAGGVAFFMDLPASNPDAFLRDSRTLVLTVPPRGRALGEDARQQYLDNLSTLSNWLSNPTHHVVFCSSTGVYGDTEGVTDEKGRLNPRTASARAVVAAEQYLGTCAAKCTVLRLAGLVGPGRHPGRFFGGRSRRIPKADAPVNLVHLDDVISAIRIVLQQEVPGAYNVCSAAHPAKGSFYTASSRALGLTVAGTEPGGKNSKLIDSSKIRALGWCPDWDDLALSYLRE